MFRAYRKLSVILFFAIFLLIGLFICGDYGISVDEIYERTSSLVTYKYLFPSLGNVVTESVDFTAIEPLHEWHDRYYGVALQLPTVVIEHIFQFKLPLRTVLQIRHIYTFLLFFAASVFFYFTSRKLTKRTWVALFGTAIFILNPRTFADAFYNMKDSVFFSIFAINLYVVFCFMEKPNWKRMAALAFVSALCANARMVGAVAAVFCCVLVLYRGIREQKRQWIFTSVGAGVLSILFYIAVSPVTWTNPIKEIMATMETFSSFPWGGSNFYMGEYIKASNLPWHYLPVWFILTIPYGYLFLAAVGGGISLAGAFRSQKKAFLLLTFLVPMFYVFLRRPVLYNGWRHFFFIYSLIALFAVMGLDGLSSWVRAGYEKIKRKAGGRLLPSLFAGGAGVLASLILLLPLGWMVKNHPHQYVYFNPGLRKAADAMFDKDYWGVTTYDLLEWILANDDRDNIKTHMFLSWALNKLEPEERDRLEQISADRAEHITYQFAASSESPQLNPYYTYPKEYSIQVDNMEVGTVFWGLWDRNSYSTVKLKGESGQISYSMGNMEWDLITDNGESVLRGELAQPVVTDWLCVETSKEDYFEDAILRISSDGQQWKEFSLAGEEDSCSRFGEFAHIRLEEKEAVRYIEVVHPEDDNEVVLNFNLYGKLYEENQYNEEELSWVEVTASNVKNEELMFALDNDINTRWSVNPQDSDVIFAFTLKEEMTIDQIELALGEDVYDGASGLKIYVSSDEENWTELSYETNGVDYQFEPVSCRYVRMILPPAPERESNWTVREMRVYRAK